MDAAGCPGGGGESYWRTVGVKRGRDVKDRPVGAERVGGPEVGEFRKGRAGQAEGRKRVESTKGILENGQRGWGC